MTSQQVARTSIRTQHFPESIIREMTRIAHDVGAVNLSQGFPDFPVLQTIKEAAKRAIQEDWNQYSMSWGLKPLREAIATHYRQRYEMDVCPDGEVVVCCGGTESMIAAMLGVVNPSDEVIVFEPYYETYIPNCLITQSTPRFVSLRLNTDGNWAFDPDELRQAFTQHTKAIILNTPHNPTGKVFTREELQTIADLCIEHDVIAITDEIYEFITYDGAQHIPLATLPGMAERTITVSSMSKTFNVTGWRLGYAVAPADLMVGIRKAHDFMSACAATPLQVAGIAMMNLGDDYYQQLREEFAQRRAFALEMLRAAGFRPVAPQGAYYIMADFSALSDEDDITFGMRLMKEIGVAGVPGSPFFNRPESGRNFLRFAFCKKLETLAQARERLARLSA